MGLPELRLAFADVAAFERELASNLKYGRAFSSEVAAAEVLSDCLLVLVHPTHSAELPLPAQIVMVSAEGAMRGTGIELRPFGPAVIAQVEEFIRAPPLMAAAMDVVATSDGTDENTASALAADAVSGVDLEATETQDVLDAQQPPDHEDAISAALAATDATSDDGFDVDPELEASESLVPPTSKSLPPDVQVQNKQEKLRHLNVTEQLKVARTGELNDRVVVERLYGKQVWEALLHNPRLTIPEVARIARKGTVPKPLLDVIIDNTSWIKTPQVRRALLGNPKVGTDAISKLLRVTPKHELKLIEKGSAYAMPVREAARKLLKE